MLRIRALPPRPEGRGFTRIWMTTQTQASSSDLTFFARMRAAAEQASHANGLMLADRTLRETWRESENKKQHISWAASSRGNIVSGENFAEKRQFLGGIIAVGGVTGMMVLGAANQAAAGLAAGMAPTAISSVLASAAAPLAALGSVAVSGGVIPVAFFAAVGVAAVGAAITVFPKRTDRETGNAVAQAIEYKDREAIASLLRPGPTIRDWLQGARDVMVQKWKSRSDLSPSQIAFLAPTASAVDNYRQSGFLSGNSLQEVAAKDALVQHIINDIKNTYGVALNASDLDSTLSDRRSAGTFEGPVVAVDHHTGLVVQKVGNQFVTHQLDKFQTPPVKGQALSIGYKPDGEGRGAISKVKPMDVQAEVQKSSALQSLAQMIRQAVGNTQAQADGDGRAYRAPAQKA